ncbi:MAG TPA: hypothetical protein VM032_19250 [Vicinamibacterales bacterium]|nr:hypothetical protein [Vicinamibacterales bacterium]
MDPSELDPFRVVLGVVASQRDSDLLIEVASATGRRFGASIAGDPAFSSHQTRVRDLVPRLLAAYDALSEPAALGAANALVAVPSPRPFLDHDQWVKLRKLGKARISEEGLNPRTRRQRQELYWFMLICVGAALRVGEAYSLRWRDCQLIKLNDEDHTEAVHMWVLGKHSRGGRREEAYGMFGAVSAFKAMRAERPDAKPDDPLFLENHREGMKELLDKAGLRYDAEGRTRDSKSLRQMGISMGSMKKGSLRRPSASLSAARFICRALSTTPISDRTARASSRPI